MRGFLLDSHVPSVLAVSVKRLAPDCEIMHLADWRDGRYLHASDEEILTIAREDDLVLVTYDTSTVPGLIHDWIVKGEPCAGVALISSRSGRVTDIGSLARAIARVYANPGTIDPAYPVVYLQPIA